MSVATVIGARPQFIKAVSVSQALQRRGIEERLIHTGQHFDPNMSDVFFKELGIPEPWKNLGIHGGSHGEMTARMLTALEAAFVELAPRVVVVYGDTNSTLAGALAAAKLGIPVVHVEAGLRSFDRTMPEEVNRVLTDAISDLLLVTEPSGIENLEREGVDGGKVKLVGNTMIDTLLDTLPKARARRRAEALGLEPKTYGLLTLHRPANVDDPAVLRPLLGVLAEIAGRMPLVFPVHPRTAKAMEAAGLELDEDAGWIRLDPQPYVDNLSLMDGAGIVLTDSGGMQEESAALGIPCITLRDTTERPVTLSVGASRLAASDPVKIRAAFEDFEAGRWGDLASIDLWDGKAGRRVAAAIADWLAV